MKILSKFYLVIILISIVNFLFVSNSYAVLSSASSPSSELRNQKFSQKEASQKAIALKEIERRIISLNKLIQRIGEMKKLSDTNKTSLINQAKEQITSLEALRVKLNSDTDPETLKTDRQLISKQYRIYMLFIPRIQILASADRIIEITDDISLFVTKIQDRLSKASSEGKNVSSMQASLKEIQNKLADAKLQAQAAADLATPLLPDNGDSNLAKSNQKTLQEARSKLVLAKKDLSDIEKYIMIIRNALVKTEKSKISTSSADSEAE